MKRLEFFLWIDSLLNMLQNLFFFFCQKRYCPDLLLPQLLIYSAIKFLSCCSISSFPILPPPPCHSFSQPFLVHDLCGFLTLSRPGLWHISKQRETLSAGVCPDTKFSEIVRERRDWTVAATGQSAVRHPVGEAQVYYCSTVCCGIVYLHWSRTKRRWDACFKLQPVKPLLYHPQDWLLCIASLLPVNLVGF